MKERRTQRTQKLLIMVGEEGIEFEGRDYKKLSEVIVETYLADKDSDINSYEEFLSDMLSKVTKEIPLKQHIYAGLTAEIKKQNHALGEKIIQKSFHELQTALCNMNIQESINLVKYLAQLMNISLLNSLTFFNIMDDLITALQNQSNPLYKQIYTNIFVRCLPIFAFSLHEKMFHDFKKLLGRAKKHCYKDQSFIYIYERQQKGNHQDNSLMNRLQTSFKEIQQVQLNIKLNIKPVQGTQVNLIEYYQLIVHENDKLYQQFFVSEGITHRNNIEHLIETFKSNKTILAQKLHTYMSNYRSSFMVRLVSETLVSKAMKNPKYIVQTSLIISLGKQDEDFSKNIQEIILNLFNEGQDFTFDIIIHFSNIVSSLLTNWQKKWEWDKMLQNPDNFLKRKILLIIILEKMVILNDKFKAEGVQNFMPPQNKKNQAKYKTVDEMENYEKFVGLLKNKADSEQVITQIDSDKSYEVFLEALFEKTSASLTHLNILMERYKGVFQKYQKEYDWTLITKIRLFWKNSLLHKILYLSFIVRKNYCKFDSYVKYVGKLEAKDKEEDIWIKIELNQLHKEFGNLLK